MNNGIRKLVRVQFVTIILFVIFKVLRPYMLQGDFGQFAEIFVLSFPNFCEAIIGTMTVCGLGLLGNKRFLKSKKQFNDQVIYMLAVFFAAIYVLLQETKVHNLGGNNVYDPNDVLFSVIGLIVAYIILRSTKPSLSSD